jgi:hypothetical protein
MEIDVSDSIGVAFLSHFERFFGEIVDRFVFRIDEKTPAIQILEFKPGIPGCRTFSTFGLSHFSEDIGQTGELYMPVEGAAEHVPRILAETCFLLSKERIRFGRGTLVRGIETVAPAFVARWNKAGVYLTMPFGCPPGFEDLKGSGFSGYILLAVLVSEQEMAFISSYGARRFENLLESKGVDPLLISRPSAV